ncbi:hypothetical protein FGB62_331g08 [Gracilaria domingensis]|nr:hypothetical protein FGB62_331g08 [Gracilaria domingensis]
MYESGRKCALRSNQIEGKLLSQDDSIMEYYGDENDPSRANIMEANPKGPSKHTTNPSNTDMDQHGSKKPRDESDSSYRPSDIGSETIDNGSGSNQSYSEQASSNLSDCELWISDGEVRDLFEDHNLEECTGQGSQWISNIAEARSIAVEDVWSSLFVDGVENILESNDDSTESEENKLYGMHTALQREQKDREGGLTEWDYRSPFQKLSIDIDNINSDS